SSYRTSVNVYNYVSTIKSKMDTVFNNMNSTVVDVYNKYANQSKYVWTNPSVLGFMAKTLRDGGDRAKTDMNKNIPGDIWAPVRSVANDILNATVYKAANIMDNLAGAIKSAHGN